MQDFVIVSKGNESDFIVKAKELGFEGVVLLYTYDSKAKLPTFTDDFVKTGWFLDKKIFKDFSSFEFVVALGTKFSKLPRGVTHVVYNEFEEEKDFIHQRRGGLNHVFLNGFSGEVLFGFGALQGSERSVQSQVVGRMMQNSKLCKDFSVVSMASKVSEMRALVDVKAFSRVLKRKSL